MKGTLLLFTLSVILLVAWTNARRSPVFIKRHLRNANGEGNSGKDSFSPVSKSRRKVSKGKRDEKNVESLTTVSGERGRNDMIRGGPTQRCGNGDNDECNSPDGSSVKGGDRNIQFYPFQAPVYPD
ncbi:hypothetical protein ECG_09466 [Echinococcus granulosus]|nr:hypothetical protein ECG_09466 [Echinococcus granulosus]